MTDYLRAFGGNGKFEGKKIYRLITGDAIPLGLGLTSSPAADVRGIATEKTKEKEISLDVSKLDKEALKATDTPTAASKENSSQKIENTVNIEKEHSVMKINSLADITDDNLKQTNASEITDWVKSELNKASESYVKEKEKLNTQIKAAQEAQEKLTKDCEKLQADLKQVSTTMETLQKEKESRARQDAFNVRMSKLDEGFDLSDKEREVIAGDIAELADEAFAKYEAKLEILLAAKKKCKGQKAPCSKQDEKQDQKEDELEAGKKCKASEEKTEDKKVETKTAKASVEDQEVVDNAVDNAEKKEAVAATTTPEDKTILARFQKAFGVDQWISDVKLTEDKNQ
jgi:hypothetical protein